MTSLLPGTPACISLARGEVLTIATDAVSTARYGRIADTPGGAVPDFPSTWTALAASKTATIGPYPAVTRWMIESQTGSVTLTQAAATHNRFEVIGDASGIREMVGAGAPTDGVTAANVAAVGSRYTDTTAGNLYINAGTKASPTWKLITRAA